MVIFHSYVSLPEGNDYQVATKGEMGENSSFLGRLPPLSAVGAAQF